MRVFVGLELSDDARRGLSAVAALVRRLDPAWGAEKWVAPENLHVTLAFAGGLDEASTRGLVASLGPALARLEPEDVVLRGLVAVPSPRRAVMLWAVPGCDTPGVSAVAAEVMRLVAEAGGVNDERPFRAHLTLVRARRPRRVARAILDEAWGVAADPASASGSASASHDPELVGKPAERIVSGGAVTVFSSTLTPRGPIYEVLARIPVGGA